MTVLSDSDAARVGSLRRLPLITCVLALVMAVAAVPARAQTYPNRPVKIVVPFPPGGATDVAARLVAQKLGEVLGQSTVVENRTGASGTIGVDAVVRAEPDGYTILVTTGDFITVPAEMFPTMSFDPHKALVAISRIATYPLVLVANAKAPFADVKELIAAAKASPGKYTFSSPGVGTINQLAVEWLAIDAGIKLLHVPYRGGAPATNAISAGEVQLGAMTQSTAQAAVQSGLARALGLMTKDKPAFVGKLETMAEQGLPAIDASLFVGLYAPASTPAEIVERLGQAMEKALEDPTLRQRFNAIGAEAAPLRGSAFKDYIASTAGHYTRIVREAGIKIEK
jgi:tripartite-type tricarboxylate transporter receptor subunit TctC